MSRPHQNTLAALPSSHIVYLLLLETDFHCCVCHTTQVSEVFYWKFCDIKQFPKLFLNISKQLLLLQSAGNFTVKIELPLVYPRKHPQNTLLPSTTETSDFLAYKWQGSISKHRREMTKQHCWISLDLVISLLLIYVFYIVSTFIKERIHDC